MPVKSIERCHFQAGLIAIVVEEFCQRQTLFPTLVKVQNACSQHIFQNLIYSFRLTNGLRMITGTAD
jgi:hypothetical protein